MSGTVIAIVGSMFSGKSTGLISYLKRATIAKQSVVLFKPDIDNRYSDSEVVSHDGERLPAIPVKSSKEILELSSNANVIGLDEVQFFDDGIIDVVCRLADLGKNVVVAGLSSDFMGTPFEISAKISMLADEVKKLSAVCMKCGQDAIWTQRVIAGSEVVSGDRVQVGGLETYEPRCRDCFVRREE